MIHDDDDDDYSDEAGYDFYVDDGDDEDLVNDDDDYDHHHNVLKNDDDDDDDVNDVKVKEIDDVVVLPVMVAMLVFCRVMVIDVHPTINAQKKIKKNQQESKKHAPPVFILFLHLPPSLPNAKEREKERKLLTNLDRR